MVHVIGKGHLFTRFTIFRPKSACNESGKAMFGEGIHWRRRSSYAASLPSDIQKAPNQHKRVPKHERRVMVELFTKKYREEHGGKFPPLTLAQKEVGGGYYVIREILQELEYKSKMSTEGVGADVQIQSDRQVHARSEVKDDSNDKQLELEEESCSAVLEAENCVLEHDFKDSSHPCPQTIEFKLNSSYLQESHDDVFEARNCVTQKDCKDSSNLCPEKTENSKLNNFQAVHSDPVEMDGDIHERAVDDRRSESLVHSSAGDQHVISDTVAAESHPHYKKIQTDTLPKDAKDNPKKHAEFVDSMEITNSKNNEHPELDRNTRENTTTMVNDAEISGRSTFWGNLKSLADGIINIWRKR